MVSRHLMLSIVLYIVKATASFEGDVLALALRRNVAVWSNDNDFNSEIREFSQLLSVALHNSWSGPPALRARRLIGCRPTKGQCGPDTKAKQNAKGDPNNRMPTNLMARPLARQQLLRRANTQPDYNTQPLSQTRRLPMLASLHARSAALKVVGGSPEITSRLTRRYRSRSHFAATSLGLIYLTLNGDCAPPEIVRLRRIRPACFGPTCSILTTSGFANPDFQGFPR
jgi:hypothetical protein